MDRKFSEIQQQILDAKDLAMELSPYEVLTTSEQTINSVTSSSKVSTWRIIVWVIAYAIWNHEKIVSKNAENSRPHNIAWYGEKIFEFRDGLPLVWLNGQFKYNLDGVVDAEERKIIKRRSIQESNDGELVIKIATENAGNLEPVSAPQLLRFTEYMNLIKDAGNRLRIINQPGDLLKLTLKVYVDVSIIDLLSGDLLNVETETNPVKDAIDGYLANLEFNGAFFKTFLQSANEKAPGVKLPLIEEALWKYADFDFEAFNEYKIPQAGYFKINPDDLIITYLNKNDLVND